jgi:hypothetical protein
LTNTGKIISNMIVSCAKHPFVQSIVGVEESIMVTTFMIFELMIFVSSIQLIREIYARTDETARYLLPQVIYKHKSRWLVQRKIKDLGD